jgi:hypothetical protein
MKYTTEIDIELPREQVIELLNNPENMKYWQRRLLSYEELMGTPGAFIKQSLKYLTDFKNFAGQGISVLD